MTDVRDELEKEAEVTTAGNSQDVVQESQIAAAPAEADVAVKGEPPAEGASDVDAGDTASGQYDEAFPALEAGSIIKGRVIQVGEDEVMVDVGYKSEGRIPLAELGLRSGQKPSDVVKVDDVIDVMVLQVEEEAEGSVVLSRRRALSRVVWEKLEAAKEAGESIEATVTGRIKGGLLVDVGVRGFVPASHVSRGYVEDLDKYVGQTLLFKIIEIDKQRNNVVLSHKLVLEEEYARAKEETFANLTEGTIVKGTVRRITDFGAFVDIGSGVEGLLHVSEMAWSRVKHPSDVVKEGDVIDVMVLKVDRENERISLSLKETTPDPWETIGQKFVIGEIVEGVVTRVVDFGAFVKLADGIEGLVHISQLADHRVNAASDVVAPGDVVKAKIVSLDERARRIGLSIRETLPKPEREPKETKEPKAPKGNKAAKAREPEQTTFGDAGQETIGDRFPGLAEYIPENQGDKEKK